MATTGTEIAVAEKTLAIVLLGPPNAGKTSLYNHLTGSRFKTVNYPGATVEYSVGRLRSGTNLDAVLLDTPGTVSLVPRSADEQVAVGTLTNLETLVDGAANVPDVVIVAMDATQPARHLPLARQVRDSGFRVVVAMTMNDLARKRGRALSADKLSQELGTAVVEVDGRRGTGLAELLACVEVAVGEPGDPDVVLPAPFTDAEIREQFQWADQVARASAEPTSPAARPGKLLSDRIDRLVLNPVLGPILFVVVMSGLFWLVNTAAAPLMDLVDGFFSGLAETAAARLPEAWWSSLLVDGLIAGFGSVFVFVPQIAVLFLVMGLLEDSGYLARAAMLVDKPLSMVGLNGKSFVPLLSGNACAIPAAMAARTIPGRRERYLTLLVAPLMSCGARLPVWGLLLAFLLPAASPWQGGLALTSIYVASVAIAAVVAAVGGRILRIEPSHTGFQIELPLWRTPMLRSVVVSAADRTWSYIKRAGLVITVVSAAFWLFMNLPDPDHSVAMTVGHWLQPLLAPMGLDWRVGVALIAAFAAREVFVSALAVVFAVQGDVEESTGGLLEAMRSATFAGSDQPIFTVATCVGLVVFFIIAMQCMTTVAVMRREASDRFALGQMFGFIGLAWVLASLTVQGLRLLGIQ